MMRLGHLSDCHLGFRRHERATGGTNTRERDVALAFKAAVDGVLAANVDLVCISGDLFHEPKPNNNAICFAVTQLKRLRDAGIPVVVCAGNHDTARKSETGSIFPLLRDLIGVDVAIREAKTFDYPALDLTVTAVPDVVLKCGHRDVLQPCGNRTYRVLVVHGEVEGIGPSQRSAVDGGIVAPDELSDEWSYQAWGDYHTAHQVGPRAWYSGSTEYTSTNIWEELDTPKGWLLVDLESGCVELQPIPLARPIYDLEPIEAADLTGEQVSALIADRLAQQDITNALVRLKVRDIAQPVRRQLDHKMIREAKARALDLHLVLQAPDKVLVGGAAQGANRGRTLDQIVEDFFRGFQPSPGIDQAALASLARETMADAAEAEAAKLARRGAA